MQSRMEKFEGRTEIEEGKKEEEIETLFFYLRSFTVTSCVKFVQGGKQYKNLNKSVKILEVNVLLQQNFFSPQINGIY